MSCCTRKKTVSKKSRNMVFKYSCTILQKKKHLQQNPAVVPYVFFFVSIVLNVLESCRMKLLSSTLAMCIETPTLVRQRIRLIPKTTLPLGCISLVYLQCNCSASSLKGKVFQSTASPATENLPRTPTLTRTSDTNSLL